jgi:hypothetical protein
LGGLKFSEKDDQEISRLKALAGNEVVYDGNAPSSRQTAILCSYEVAWFLVVDQEEGIGQYHLLIKGSDGEPPLSVVQAMAAAFFGNKPYEIMPEPRSLSIVRVGSLFFPYAGGE